MSEFLVPFENMRGMFADFDIELSENAYEMFDIYAKKLVEYNEKVNLTTIVDPAGIAEKHFLDSVIPLSYVDVTDGASIADIGTGAGFPGIPMLIMRPKCSLTLIESNGKRVTFLNELIDSLRAVSKTPLKADIVVSRAEDCARGALREHFDIVTARAVAALPILAEYCLPFAKVGGEFLALKGSSEVYEQGAAAVEALGGDLSDFVEYTLPTAGARRLFIIDKLRRTPKQFPRSNAQIRKSPL